MLAKEIRDGWAASATGYASVIRSITNCGYEAVSYTHLTLPTICSV